MKNRSTFLFGILCVCSLTFGTACNNSGNNDGSATSSGESGRGESSSSTTGTSGSTGNQSKEEHNASNNDAAGTMTNTNRSTSGIDE